MRLQLLILTAAGFALAACTPETETPMEPAAPPEAPVETTDPVEAAPEEPAPDAAPQDDVRDYFEATFTGRWGMDASCAEEGMFRLSPDELTLYERRCEVLSLTRDGDMIAARTQCTEEGQPMAENTTMLTPAGDDTITVSDGHYEWTRVNCGDVEG
ncbi:MAG: hypothetical protein ACFE0P_04285 [Oceanicaulis sp.]